MVVLAADLRHEALARLDREFLAYRHDSRYPRTDTPIRAVEYEARDLVESRGFVTHPTRNHRAFIYGPGCPENDAHKCGGCLRFFAIIVAACNVTTRGEFRPLLNWILDPEYMA